MEVLVDTLTFLAPLALYTKMGTFNIISTGLLTLFFKGLLELSKSFLDPFGREGYRAHNIRVDVLVSEMNFGASSRWLDAGDALPSELLERKSDSTHYGKEPSDRTDNLTFAEWVALGDELFNKENVQETPALILPNGKSKDDANWFEMDEIKHVNGGSGTDEDLKTKN